MVEPKGGPVKPPILDLKAKKSTPKPVSKPAVKKPGKFAAKSTSTSTTQASDSPTQTSSSTTGTNSDNSQKNQPKAKDKSPANNIFPLTIAAFGGALLAIILVVLLILSGILKPLNQATITTDIDSLSRRTGIVEEQITQNLVGFSVMDEQVNALRQQISSDIEPIASNMDLLSAQLNALEQQQTSFAQDQSAIFKELEILQQVDNFTTDPAIVENIKSLEDAIGELNLRFTAIASGASFEDAAKLGNDIVNIQQQLAQIPEQIQNSVAEQLSKNENPNAEIPQEITQEITNAITEQISGLVAQLQAANTAIEENRAKISSLAELLDSTIQNLNTQISELQNTNNQALDGQTIIVQEPKPQEPQNMAAQQSSYLPLALMKAQYALENGQGFQNELQSISSFLPTLEIPQNIWDIAALERELPSQIIMDFNRALPEMLAARPNDPDANWLNRFGNSLRSLFALRPLDPAKGDNIESLIARIEAVMNRADFASAANLISQLPQPMILALGESNDKIIALGSASTLLANARAMALINSQTGPEPMVISQ